MIHPWHMLLFYVIAFQAPSVASLGINCRGSGVCPLATLFAGSKNAGQDIIQGLLSTINQTTLPDSTTYSNGEHIACVSNTIPISFSVGPPFVSVSLGGGIPAGGICAFPQSLPSGKTLSLTQIRSLAQYVVQHGCNTCGSVPITFPDNQEVNKVGQLTFNFVSQANLKCDDKCISASSNSKIGSGDGNTVTVTVPAATSSLITSRSGQGSPSTAGAVITVPAVTVTMPAATTLQGTTTVSGPATVTVIVNNGASEQKAGVLLSILVLYLSAIIYMAS